MTTSPMIGRMGGTAALVAFTLFIAPQPLAHAQAPAQPAASPPLGILAPANLAKPRPKAPFDLTGTWLHNSPTRNGSILPRASS